VARVTPAVKGERTAASCKRAWRAASSAWAQPTAAQEAGQGLRPDTRGGAAQAARLTLVQLLINSKGLQMNPLQSLYYISPACLLCLTPPLGARASLAWFACTSC